MHLNWTLNKKIGIFYQWKSYLSFHEVNTHLMKILLISFRLDLYGCPRISGDSMLKVCSVIRCMFYYSLIYKINKILCFYYMSFWRYEQCLVLTEQLFMYYMYRQLIFFSRESESNATWVFKKLVCCKNTWFWSILLYIKYLSQNKR